MPRKPRVISNSGYYHILSRGIGKQIIFEDDHDYLYFLKILARCREEEDFEIIAYCLMENHFHILMKAESGLDRIMKRITTSYALYFNTKYERVGHLFQNRYKSVPAENDSAILSMVRYIHNNPEKAGICPANQYKWSSWREYMGEVFLISPELVLSLVGGQDGFLKISSEEDTTIVEQLEITEPRRINDKRAQQIIREKLKFRSGTEIQGIDRKNRDHVLHLLKTEGLSIRQIERLTGINRGIIQKA
ncbi:MAG: transposase [Lachnospiraceae bacterium]|nr:transposase [Lachnospiraceae bacterium]